MSKNIHAELMLQYAEDWAETDEPWLRWEFKPSYSDTYRSIFEHPVWNDTALYRRKTPTVKMICINGCEVPAPLREKPLAGSTYFIPDLDSKYGYRRSYWDSLPSDKRRLRNGMVHATQEGAIAHAKALLSLTESTENG